MVMEAQELIMEALQLPRGELARVAAVIDAELFELSMEDGNL